MTDNNKIKVALVDDHQIVIDGLKAVLHQQQQVEIVVTANSGQDILTKLQHHPIDILLSDVMMEGMNGQQLARAVKQQFPHIKIIALSMSGAGDIVEEMINDADIHGYLLKQTDKEELLQAILKVYHGGQYFQPQILAALEQQSNRTKQVLDTRLTVREIEIIRLMEQDLSNKQLAETLNISIRTVETHRKNIFKKTNTNNLLTLVKWAYEHQLLSK
jgi:two-component system, NarL family, nitrate/nitrite response regulator NarL